MSRRGWGVICLAALFGVGAVQRAHAWGDTGHRIICEIAFQELQPAARAEVVRLIRLDPDFRQFSMSCIFPDHPRKRRAEHFVNVARSAKAIGDNPCPLSDKCVITAIRHDFAVLSDTAASDADKLEALKFLGHWVGDVHQPLHVSFQDDRGGNRIGETGPCRGSLHAVWDTCIIETQLGTEIESIASALLGTVTAEDRAAWRSRNPIDWANESFQITISPEVEYCFEVGGVCRYDRDHEVLKADEPERQVRVDEAYMRRQLPTLKRRLTQAGIRLGALLNEALNRP
jgi:hypothetical protein